jgi:hypothetical protein
MAVLAAKRKDLSRKLFSLRAATICAGALWDCQLPVGVIASHLMSRDVVCMHDCPRTRIAVAEQNHPGFRLEGSVEPRQSVRCGSSQFDLDDVPHCT